MKRIPTPLALIGAFLLGAVSLVPVGAQGSAVSILLRGVVPSVNSGNKDTGTIRAVIATDQPQLTNKLLVTPDANSAVNVAQMNGVTVTMGNGASGTGVQRVTLANDSTGVVGLNTGSNLVGYVGRKPTYGSKTTITWSGAPGGTGIANGSARESTVIDWTSTRCADGRVRIQSKLAGAGTGAVNWYVYTSLGDTTYTDGATGSDANFTAANRLNSPQLGALMMNGTTSVIGEFQLGAVFSVMPDKWGLIGVNNSGAALSNTSGDHVVEYMCVN